MISYLPLKKGGKLAYHYTEGKQPGVVFLGGFRSDMSGVKAMALEAWCKKHGRAFLRFDYEGHGESSGNFEDGTIGLWLKNARLMLTKVTQGRQILVGSSMGGWLALLLAMQKPKTIAGIIGIAAAPDFTEIMMFETMSKAQIETLETQGKIMVKSDFGEQYPITRELIVEARNHLLLQDIIPVRCPVVLLHGKYDEEIPWEFSLKINRQLLTKDVKTILIEKGDHRLSTPGDIEKILNVLEKMVLRFN